MLLQCKTLRLKKQFLASTALFLDRNAHRKYNFCHSFVQKIRLAAHWGV